MSIRDRLSELTQAWYEDGSQAEADNQAGDGSIRGSELEMKALRLEEALAADLEALIREARIVNATAQDQGLAATLAKFVDE